MMRKWMLMLLVLCLMAVPGLAEEAQLIEYDFGDFTMTFPEDTVGEIADEISPGQPFFMIFQDYDEANGFNKNLNGVWTEAYQDLTEVNPEEFANTVIQQAVDQFVAYNIKVENATLLMAALDEQDGKPALSLMYSTDLDYTGAGVDLQMTLYTLQGIVSDKNFGTYTFTISTDDVEAAQPLMEIMNTIAWKD